MGKVIDFTHESLKRTMRDVAIAQASGKMDPDLADFLQEAGAAALRSDFETVDSMMGELGEALSAAVEAAKGE